MPSFVVDALLPASCLACGRPAAGFCARCDSLVQQPMGEANAAFIFAGPLAEAIRGAKYGPDRARVRGLALFLAASVALGRVTLPPHDAICFVPAHWRRRVLRGFDLPAVLARALSRSDRPLVDALVARRFDPRLARSASAAERSVLVRDRFGLRRRDLAGRTLLLLDDVVTTGSTLREAARVLASGGAQVVPYALAAAP